ncbi:MAG: nucleotidyltransferase family protein [Armatimonadetes bacterium]|nr:nucleotidyltransferase family protein [Armatimonadota bacterium]
MMPPIPAMVLAGGKAGDALAEGAGVAYKALVPLRGRPMLAYVLDALAETRRVSRVLLVGPEEVAAVAPGIERVPDAGSFLGNLAAGVAACGDAPYCLVLTCDVPAVTGPILDEFVALATERGVDLAYPIVELRRCQERFPGMGRTSLRIREGLFTGGNAVLMRPAFLARNAGVIEAAFAVRKHPLQLGGMIGWGVVARILLARRIPGVLPLRLLEERIGRIVGGRVAGIIVPHPEIGADIDKPEDLAAMAT